MGKVPRIIRERERERGGIHFLLAWSLEFFPLCNHFFLITPLLLPLSCAEWSKKRLNGGYPIFSLFDSSPFLPLLTPPLLVISPFHPTQLLPFNLSLSFQSTSHAPEIVPLREHAPLHLARSRRVDRSEEGSFSSLSSSSREKEREREKESSYKTTTTHNGRVFPTVFSFSYSSESARVPTISSIIYLPLLSPSPLSFLLCSSSQSLLPMGE